MRGLAAMLAISGVVAAAVGQLAWGEWQTQDDVYREVVLGENLVTVYVATRDLPEGTRLTIDDLRAVEVARQYLPEGVFLVPDGLVGQTLAQPQYAQEMIRAERVEQGP